MNFEYFLAKRLIKGAADKVSISAPIIKIAIAAIALGIIMMLVALATGVGLKYKIREKVAAFNGHIQIANYDNNASDVSVVPVSLNQEFYPNFESVDGIAHVQAVASKGGIIRTDETFEGIIAKGVGKDYDWSVFEDYLVAGKLPDYSGELNNQVLMSRLMADRLRLKTGDSFFSFFLKDDDVAKVPNQRKFTITGLYDSGFEEFDALYLFTDIRHVQRMNRWDADQVGNFEVFLEDFDALDAKSREIYGKTLSSLDTQTIIDKYYKIFEWIGLFDFNIVLIIAIVIGINFGPWWSLALGSANWSIRKVFLFNAAYLIGIGLVWGNVIGLGALWVQNRFKVIQFPNPQEYYIDYVPVYIDVPTVLLLNLGVLVLCLLMLLLPSYIVTKITPVKAIKFE